MTFKDKEKQASYHKNYYNNNKEKLCKARKVAQAKKEWDCVNNDNFDFWVEHRPHLKYLFLNKDKIEKEKLIKFIDNIYGGL